VASSKTIQHQTYLTIAGAITAGRWFFLEEYRTVEQEISNNEIAELDICELKRKTPKGSNINNPG
jgi:hypothetical protein